MSLPDISLADKYDLEKSHILLSGTQALVRLMLMQSARDRAAGLNTAGLVTGYRGSPLGAVDSLMARNREALEQANVRFQPGLNEDLAATALWGSQQAELRGEGRFDGVFGLWYGKGPGVDRSGDAMRHANMAGTSPYGGVLMAMGDDHTGESSTVLHQSEWALVDAYMPVLSPAGVQEILDYGLYGYALSRFSGLWVGLKTMKDTVEATSVVDGAPGRMRFSMPDFQTPEGGLNIRLGDTPHAQEARMIDHKRFAAEAFAHANRIDRRVWGMPGAKIGLVAAGKNWLDLTHALHLLGIGEDEALMLGLTTYKVGQTWPLDMKGFNAWAKGLDLIVVVEEKRKLIEVQIKEALFDRRASQRVFGWHRNGEELFATRGALEPVGIALSVAEILADEGRENDRIRAHVAQLREAQRADNAPDLAARLPYFCAGCPHNTSTRLPEGARGYAGIGCHYMVQWMDRETTGFTQMGGEGANWIGEAPFSKREHVFQNLGDGTYNHSGILAIRAALAAGTRITYKILFNDAVAMTGGQTNEGGLSADRIARELEAMGVGRIALVYDEKEAFEPGGLGRAVTRHTRDDVIKVQEELARHDGVSAMIYVQTCAAEKRRRRKRGAFPDPDKRLFINTDVCEGCGDCGVQSNCVALVPKETPLGRKRAIDQSACNKDFSCVNGFCPSFVSVAGAKLRSEPRREVELPEMEEPVLPVIEGTYNMVITGVGGTGVVTIGAILAQAAQIDGLGAGMMEMAGLAQKGGAVHIHCRLAQRPEHINAIRVATGECDALIGGDLVVSAGSKTLGLTKPGRTGGVVNSHEIITGEFTRNPGFSLPAEQLSLSLKARLKERLFEFDASELARAALGDSLYSNMILFGAAWQRGLVPISGRSIRQAIMLNGASVDDNLRAFETGRWAVLHPEETDTLLTPAEILNLPEREGEEIDRLRAHLEAYQGPRLVARFNRLLALATDHEMRLSVARGFHKLLSYKDEYEVARLLLSTRAQVEAEFEGDLRLTYHLAPPMLPGKGPDGRPRKRAFGAWLERPLRWLAGMKRLRGTPFDPFGYTSERRMERRLIRQYEKDLGAFLPKAAPNAAEVSREDLRALAELPLSIRGFGPVKKAAAAQAAETRARLLESLRNEQPSVSSLPDAAQ